MNHRKYNLQREWAFCSKSESHPNVDTQNSRQGTPAFLKGKKALDIYPGIEQIARMITVRQRFILSSKATPANTGCPTR